MHVLPPRPFEHDFYGARMKLLMLGFVRPEYDYVSKESLIKDIKVDIEVTKRSLERDGYKVFREEKWLVDFSEGDEHEQGGGKE